jgi:hypothetical protein
MALRVFIVFEMNSEDIIGDGLDEGVGVPISELPDICPCVLDQRLRCKSDLETLHLVFLQHLCAPLWNHLMGGKSPAGGLKTYPESQ